MGLNLSTLLELIRSTVEGNGKDADAMTYLSIGIVVLASTIYVQKLP